MRIARIALGLAAACSALTSPSPPRSPPDRFEERRVAMGVQARVVLYAATREQADAAFAAAFARIERLEGTLSDWRPASELSQVNDAAGGPPLAVSADLLAALVRASELARASGGAFDPTLGPLAELWRRARARGRPPERAAVDAALAKSGWQKLDVDPARRSVRLAEAGMRLDLGAIGAGIACDAALAVLREQGCASALVEIGGDLAAGDPPPGQRGWTVAAGGRTLTVANQGVGSSGDAEQRLEVAETGARYSHVLDPRTGMGVGDGIAATVIAPDGATADALATAASVLGPREGRRLVEAEGARLLVDDPAKTRLFDGKTLAGWVTKGGRYDGDARWSVAEGCIVGRANEQGEGGLLYTEKEYTCFEFECDVQLDDPFDSGIFVRMVPPGTSGKGAQVTLDDRPGGQIAAIHSDGFLLHNDIARAHWKRGAWNHVEVRVTGFDMRIEAWLNGASVLDFEVRGIPGEYAPRGRIGLQVHGGQTPGETGGRKGTVGRFREIRVRELPVFGAEAFDAYGKGSLSITPAGASKGWRSLFDGNTLEGWVEHGTSGAWRARGGVLGCTSGKEGGELRTREDFEDFLLRLDFKTAPLANSGVFLRAKRDGSNPAFSGCEVQILDDSGWEQATGTKLADWQFTGSLYGSVPPATREALRPCGEWNSFEILCRGPRIAAALNGTALFDVDTGKVPGDPPFAQRAKAGFIGLQRHAGASEVAAEAEAGAVSFRNLFVRP